MKVSLNWVREFTDIKLSVDELVEKIGAQLGAVEEVIDLSEKYKDIVVVKVVECDKHPNADKLHVCKIDDNKVIKGVKRDGNGYVQVVCGAPNVHAGMLAAWLPPGSIVPSTFDDEQFKLEVRELRGVASNGMLASAHELGISEDHSGIVELHTLDAKPGDNFATTYRLNDFVIDVENKMFTHRPDCFGILGVAREIAGISHHPFDSPSWYKSPAKLTRNTTALPLTVHNNAAKAVTRFTAVVLQIDYNSSSPLCLQTYLSRVGLRPINTVVDITNYVMHLTGQPLHAYDYDKLASLSPRPVSLETRLSRKGEKLRLLNGKEITLADDKTVLITSNDIPVGVGGVMGGADTEVDENTKRIVLECANFDMYTIRKTSMQYGLFTDAVTRFNKGQSNLQQDRVLSHAALLMCKLAKGEIAGEMIDKHTILDQPKPVKVTPHFINERLGLNLTASKITELLENVEFKVIKAAGHQLAVTPPFWRTDIHIPEDIVEEVGRLWGYDHLEIKLPTRDLAPAAKNSMLSLKQQIRGILSRSGANEVLTYSFVHGDLLQKVGQSTDHAFRLGNALSPELQYYRLSLLPSLLNIVHANIKAGYDEFALFEIGKAHIKGLMDANESDLPGEEERLALVFAANDKAAKAACGGAPYYQAVVYLDELCQHLGVNYSLEPIEHEPARTEGRQALAPFDKARTAYVRVNDEEVGLVGEFSAATKRALKLPGFTAGLELDIRQLAKFTGSTNVYTPLPRFPKVEQDITLKIATNITYSELFSTLWFKLNELKPDNTLTTLVPLDIYQKDEAERRYTWRLAIASYERTLTDQEVNRLLDDLATVAQDKFGAERV